MTDPVSSFRAVSDTHRRCFWLDGGGAREWSGRRSIIGWLDEDDESLSWSAARREVTLHAGGVATVVAILFNAIRPDLAFFGQKDAQQVAVIRRMTTDLGFETEIVVVPTVREESGLALSSRNRILPDEEREKAAVIFAGLREAKVAFKQGERNAAKLIEIVQRRIAEEPLAVVDYISVVDGKSLEAVEKVGETETFVAAAVRFGKVRLIDNVVLNRGQ